MNDTRDRILETARRRFTEHGYDGTSLRDISDELGFSKAALYYHFQRKDEILAALLEPAEVLVGEFVYRLEHAKSVKDWGDALTWVIEEMHKYLDFFLLVERNRTAIQTFDAPREWLSEHREMHERIERAVRKVSPDHTEQIRMITALAAVTGFDDWAPTVLLELPVGEVQKELKAVVSDILHTRTRGRRVTNST